ncbi:MAG: hypothetical protein ACOYJO_02045 [Eubacterium sp.]|jgi:hypothetical protein
MAFLDKVKSVAGQASDAVSDSIESAKLKGKISDEKKAIEAATLKIGKIVLDLHKAGSIELPEDAKSLIEEIEGHEAAIEDAKKAIDALKED